MNVSSYLKTGNNCCYKNWRVCQWHGANKPEPVSNAVVSGRVERKGSTYCCKDGGCTEFHIF